MIYKDIKIEKFRGIQSLGIKDLGRLNLFVGKNNSGKTSVLEAIFLITGFSNPQLALTIDLLRDLAHNEADDFKFIFYGLNYENEPKFEATLHSKEIRTLNIQPTLKSTLGSSDNSKLEITKPSATTTSENTLNAEGLVFDFSVKAYHAAKNSQKATLMFEGRNLKYTPPKNYKESLVGVFISSNTFARAELPARLEKVIVEKRKNEIIEILKIIDSNIRDIIIGTNNMIYLDTGLNNYIPSNIQGDGLNRLLAIITTIYFNKNGIVFIDEIENGFHFKIFKSLWKAIYKASEYFNVQLFITTHNYELLRELKFALDEIDMEEARNQTSTYSLVRGSENNIESIRYDYLQFENAIEQNLEIR